MPPYHKADIDILLSVCRRELGTDDRTDGTRLDDKRWRGVLAAAIDHGLIGPLHRTAPKAYFVPDEIFEAIRTTYLIQVARNFRLLTALDEILCVFAERDIEVAVLKGPAVAVLAYGEVAHREFTDLDLLVRPEHFIQARLVLDRLGYGQISGAVLDVNRGKDVEFFRDADQTFVELHWALNPPSSRFPLEATGVWDRLVTVDLLNRPIRTLNLEDTLIALCIHASKHHWTNLKWIVDIAQILQSKGAVVDWDASIERCTVVGCTRALLFGIQLANLLFDVKIPTAVTKISHSTSVMRLVNVAKDSLLQNQSPVLSDRLAFNIEIHDRMWDRVFVAATQSIPEFPSLLPAVASPMTRGPLRFLTRPVRLLYAYGFNWLRSIIVSR